MQELTRGEDRIRRYIVYSCQSCSRDTLKIKLFAVKNFRLKRLLLFINKANCSNRPLSAVAVIPRSEMHPRFGSACETSEKTPINIGKTFVAR